MTLQTARLAAATTNRRANGSRLRGWAYASPTALFVLVLFMSRSASPASRAAAR